MIDLVYISLMIIAFLIYVGIKKIESESEN